MPVWREEWENPIGQNQYFLSDKTLAWASSYLFMNNIIRAILIKKKEFDEDFQWNEYLCVCVYIFIHYMCYTKNSLDHV